MVRTTDEFIIHLFSQIDLLSFALRGMYVHTKKITSSHIINSEEIRMARKKEENRIDSIGISIPRKFFTDEQLENLNRLVASKACLIKKAMGCEELAVIADDENITFPWWKNDCGADEVHAFSTFVTKLKDAALKQKRVTAKEKAQDNEKYAFRCFLLRLGFIGDEYKKDRQILLKNFTGSSAFKSGQKKNALVPTAENTVKVDVQEALERLKDPEVQKEVKAILDTEDTEEVIDFSDEN